MSADQQAYGVPEDVKGFRFSNPGILLRRTFPAPVIDAEGVARTGLYVALRHRPELADLDDARLADIADDPSVVGCILGKCKLGMPALVAWRDGCDFTIHSFGPSSDVGTSMMAEGVAPSSAAPHKTPHSASAVAS